MPHTSIHAGMVVSSNRMIMQANKNMPFGWFTVLCLSSDHGIIAKCAMCSLTTLFIDSIRPNSV